ncbi:MAG TPA: pH homeostasis protein A, partial [Anaerolineae bacterium]|nr:pH homeostasis protein A [Anaerolineae bacterium]
MLAPPLALTGLLLSRAPAVLAGRPLGLSIAWVPSLGLSLDLSLDGLGLLFALLVAGIGTLVFLYSMPYMAGERGLGRYYGALIL